MMKNAILLTTAIAAFSCAPYKRVYKTRTDMAVVVVNDTILYFCRRGAASASPFSGANVYPYRREGNLITVPAPGKDLPAPWLMDMSPGEVFQVYQDSIVMLRNNLVFYDKGYYESNQIGETFYFIRKGVKYKATPDNPRARPYFEMLRDQFLYDIVPPAQALKEYGVDPNYDCWIIEDFERPKHDPHDLD